LQLLQSEKPTSGGYALNVWHEVQDAADSLEHYLDDLRQASDLAAKVTDRALARGETLPSLGREIGYALMAASVVSRTKNVPPVLVARAVETGHVRLLRMALTGLGRAGCLDVITASAQAIADIGGGAAVRACADGICDVERINSRWRVSENDQLFEVQFHTRASFEAKQQTHAAYEQLRTLPEDHEDIHRLRDYQREITAKVPVPPSALDIPNYP
jgi:hypothetical protein